MTTALTAEQLILQRINELSQDVKDLRVECRVVFARESDCVQRQAHCLSEITDVRSGFRRQTEQISALETEKARQEGGRKITRTLVAWVGSIMATVIITVVTGLLAMRGC